ncbi:RNA methyltransferase [bacterium]|nr:RNA methyltransferase [bacterium]
MEFRLVRLEGRNLVLDSLKAGRYIEKIYIDTSSKGDKIDRIKSICSSSKIAIENTTRSEISKLGGSDNNQGVLAFAKKIDTYSMKEFEKKMLSEEVCVVVLRNLDFEQNLGAIIRSCSGAGIKGIVVPKKKKSSITPLVERISQGGTNDVCIIEESFYSSIKALKKMGCKLVALETTSEKAYFDEDLTGNIAFIFGNESETLDSSTLEKVDITVKVPMMGTVPSLNVSVTAGIILYERFRQNLKK